MSIPTPSVSSSAGLLRLTIFIRRRSDITPAAFHSYWSTKHSQLFSSLPIVRSKLIAYHQLHFNEDSSAIALLGFPVASDYDGAAGFYAHSVQDFIDVFTSKEYQETIIPDEVNFLDRDPSAVRIHLGRDQIVALQKQ